MSISPCFLRGIWNIKVAFYAAGCYNILGAFASGCCHLRRTVCLPLEEVMRMVTYEGLFALIVAICAIISIVISLLDRRNKK